MDRSDVERIKAFMLSCIRTRTVTISREKSYIGPTQHYMRWVDIPVIDDLTGATVKLISIGLPDDRQQERQAANNPPIKHT